MKTRFFTAVLVLSIISGSAFAVSQTSFFRFLQKAGPYPVRLRVVDQFDRSRTYPTSTRNRSIKAKEGDSVAKLLTAFIRKADEGTIGKVVTPGAFNTAFRYEIVDKTGKTVARAGLADLDICLPYTLAFVRELESVEYPNRSVSLEEPEDEKVDDGVQIPNNGATK